MFYSLCYMKFKVIIVLILLLSIQNSNSENNLTDVDNIFHIGKMDSHNNNFVLFFKTRKKAILAKGEEFNYITDHPQDLYIYDRKTKETKPLITYDWFPKHAKFYLSNYDFPVFPEDYDKKGKLDFIISSIAKKCGYFDLNKKYQCNYYKPLISSNLIN